MATVSDSGKNKRAAEHPGASEEGIVVQEVGLGQCDAYCQHHGWSVMSSSFSSFSDDEADLLTAGAS